MKLNKLLLICIGFSLIILIEILYVSNHEIPIDEQSKNLCKWYASIDHKKEIADERYEKMSYLWKNFDWYESCINHIKRSYEKSKT